jgi:hypothetical protein
MMLLISWILFSWNLSNSFHSVPFHSIPFHSVPFHSTNYHEIASNYIQSSSHVHIFVYIDISCFITLRCFWSSLHNFDLLSEWHSSLMIDTLTDWHIDILTYWQIDRLTDWHIDILTYWHKRYSAIVLLCDCGFVSLDHSIIGSLDHWVSESLNIWVSEMDKHHDKEKQDKRMKSVCGWDKWCESLITEWDILTTWRYDVKGGPTNCHHMVLIVTSKRDFLKQSLRSLQNCKILMFYSSTTKINIVSYYAVSPFVPSKQKYWLPDSLHCRTALTFDVIDQSMNWEYIWRSGDLEIWRSGEMKKWRNE